MVLKGFLSFLPGLGVSGMASDLGHLSGLGCIRSHGALFECFAGHAGPRLEHLRFYVIISCRGRVTRKLSYILRPLAKAAQGCGV